MQRSMSPESARAALRSERLTRATSASNRVMREPGKGRDFYGAGKSLALAGFEIVLDVAARGHFAPIAQTLSGVNVLGRVDHPINNLL